MSEKAPYESFGGNAAENYERYFVPAIGEPVGRDLIEVAALQPGERVLDVACGTGVVTRMAADRVGDTGTVAGSDVNPAMLAVARAAAPADTSITWYETGAEAMPLPDETFDVVLCQMGLQFVANKSAALREMARVLAPGGRLVLNVPGPTPRLFSIMADALERHLGPEVSSFVHIVFSLNDAGEIRDLMSRAGLPEVDVKAKDKALRLPPPEDFLWQYIHSTPLAHAVRRLDDDGRAALTRDVGEKWREFVEDGALALTVRMTTATARKESAKMA